MYEHTAGHKVQKMCYSTVSSSHMTHTLSHHDSTTGHLYLPSFLPQLYIIPKSSTLLHLSPATTNPPTPASYQTLCRGRGEGELLIRLERKITRTRTTNQHTHKKQEVEGYRKKYSFFITACFLSFCGWKFWHAFQIVISM